MVESNQVKSEKYVYFENSKNEESMSVLSIWMHCFLNYDLKTFILTVSSLCDQLVNLKLLLSCSDQNTRRTTIIQFKHIFRTNSYLA